MVAIDLRSDTLTRPSSGMIRAMSQAEVGDDAYCEDRHVTELEEYCADYLCKPAALFMPSGTMSNQVAIRALTEPGDEVICDASYHINFFESAQASDLGKVVLNSVRTPDGLLSVRHLQEAIDIKARWSNFYSAPRLVWIENSISTHGGSIFPLQKMKEIYSWCNQMRIPLFLDGARLFNTSVATNLPCSLYARNSDALTICFSKGLGAPFGSILVGSSDFIDKARRYRKWFGGGLHQGGFMAAAALYALKNNVERLREDHENAALLASMLAEEDGLRVNKAETNMVVFSVNGLGISAKEFVCLAEDEHILMIAWRSDEVRAVTSSNVTRGQIAEAGCKLAQIARRFSRKTTMPVLLKRPLISSFLPQSQLAIESGQRL